MKICRICANPLTAKEMDKRKRYNRGLICLSCHASRQAVYKKKAKHPEQFDRYKTLETLKQPWESMFAAHMIKIRQDSQE